MTQLVPSRLRSRPATDLVSYDLVERRLDNGLRVVVNPDPTAPGVAVNLWYQVGSRDEQPGRTGFAHLFEHLMFQGTWTGVGVGEHLAAMEAAGGEANATTSFDRTNYFETVQPGALDLALWLEAQRMEALRVDQLNLDTQREVVKEEKRQRYDNVPYGDTFDLITTASFGPSHPYGHLPIGSMADLDAAALSDVTSFFEHWYAPSNASLVLSGHVTADEAFALVERHFGPIACGPAPDRAVVPLADPALRGQQHSVLREVPRDTVHLLWQVPPVGTPQSGALEVALGLLSSSQSSRLHKALVRDQELAEGISASTLGLIAGSDLALISARAREHTDLENLREELLAQVGFLASEGPSDEELDRTRAQLEREWLSELSTVDGRADEINHWIAATGDPSAVNRHLGDLLQVSADQVRQVLGEWLSEPNAITVNYLSQEPA